MIRRSAELIENGISAELLKGCISEQRKNVDKLTKQDNYYIGKHNILQREKKGQNAPNNRVVNNYPKYITDTVCGYMFGNDIVYSSNLDENLITDLKKAFKLADTDSHDGELGKDLSVFGVGYELLYMSKDESPTPKLAVIDPRNAFVVYDDSVEDIPLFGCYYFQKFGADGKSAGFNISVYTKTHSMNFYAKELKETPVLIDETTHFFNDVPLLEYWNNEEGMGDFQHVSDLIDAYNILQSDRINDKERFVNAILLIVGACLDDDEEQAEADLKNAILNVPLGADARYLTKQLNEAETEILKKAISHDIHKFSQTPDFTDENFAGVSSGVSLRYKLLSLEYLAKVKEKFFIQGLRKRIKLFANMLFKKGKSEVDTSEIEITFNRSLPINELENAQTISTLAGTGIVSDETLLSQISFVKDITAELERVKSARQEENKASLESYNSVPVDEVGL